MVKIRLRRVGAKKQASYRVVVTDSRAARDSRFIEVIGHYNPRTDPPTVSIKEDRALYWLDVGAQPTESVDRFFDKMGLPEKLKQQRTGGTKPGGKKAGAPAAAVVEMPAEAVDVPPPEAIAEPVAETVAAPPAEAVAEPVAEAVTAVAEAAEAPVKKTRTRRTAAEKAAEAAAKLAEEPVAEAAEAGAETLAEAAEEAGA